MIIDHLNTGLRGGAAIAACRIHASLREAGVTSRFWYSRRDETKPLDESYRQIIWPNEQGVSPRRIIDWALGRTKRVHLKRSRKKALAGRPSGLDLFSYPRTGWKTVYDPSDTFGSGETRGDILHLHWIANFIDYSTFFESLPDDLPVVWTLHDMNPFTGGCHYAAGCRAFETECGSCPQLGQPGERDLANQAFQIKKQAYVHKNLHIVGASRWLENEARSSQLFAGAKSFRTIHYGMDIELLKPQDRSKARIEFSLPEDGIVIGFGADSIANHRKGFRELLSALSQLRSKEKVIGLVFGGGNLPETASGSVELRRIGFVSDQVKQTLMYSAMDLFVMPSLEENLGMTGLEAMACGVPVVAFDAGGTPDYVRHDKTGLLVPVGDVEQLARALDQMVKNPVQRRTLGEAAREMIVQEFSSEVRSQDYVHLYEGLLAG